MKSRWVMLAWSGGAGWTGGHQQGRGDALLPVPMVPTWREEQHGLEQDVLSFVQLQLLQADVELEQWLQVDLLETSWGERGGNGRARMGTWLSPASRCHHSPPPLPRAPSWIV